MLEDQHMRRAVHRLDRHPLRIVGDFRRGIAALCIDLRHHVGHGEHVLGIFAPVAALLPLAHIHHLRCLDLAVVCPVHLAAHIGFEFAPDAIALGVPENRPVRLFLQVEQIHLAAELAVIALGGFLQPHEVLVQLLLVEPSGAVNARELRIVLVAAPVCTRHAHQLEGLGIELAGAGEMRTAAHIEPRAI